MPLTLLVNLRLLICNDNFLDVVLTLLDCALVVFTTVGNEVLFLTSTSAGSA